MAYAASSGNSLAPPVTAPGLLALQRALVPRGLRLLKAPVAPRATIFKVA